MLPAPEVAQCMGNTRCAVAIKPDKALQQLFPCSMSCWVEVPSPKHRAHSKTKVTDAFPKSSLVDTQQKIGILRK